MWRAHTHRHTQILNSNFYWIKFATWMHCKQTPLANSHTMLKLPPSSIQAVLILLSISSLFPSTWLANTCAQSTVINNSISRSLLECQPVSGWWKAALTLALVISAKALFFLLGCYTMWKKRDHQWLQRAIACCFYHIISQSKRFDFCPKNKLGFCLEGPLSGGTVAWMKNINLMNQTKRKATLYWTE